MGRLGNLALLASAFAGLCATASPLFASDASTRGRAASPARTAQIQRAAYQVHQETGNSAHILALHNAERTRLRLPELHWNPHLEREASEWAQRLNRAGVLEHADNGIRNGTGENLWMGTAGAWNIDSMVGMFLEERVHYRHAAFPDVSRTGNWADVGHYTQIIWRDTREVGCAVATARGNDVLVCRYFPAGNVMGARAH